MSTSETPGNNIVRSRGTAWWTRVSSAMCLAVAATTVHPVAAQGPVFASGGVAIRFQNAGPEHLGRGVAIAFQGGAILVTTNTEAASFAITGPGEYRGAGESFIRTGVAAGEYTITFGDVPGLRTPPPETRSLDAGGTVSFIGTYVAETIAISAEPRALTFGYKQGVAGPLEGQSINVVSVGAAAEVIASASVEVGDWLTVSPARSTTPTVLTVMVAHGLAPGGYRGEVVISTGVPGVNSIRIPVTLDVWEGCGGIADLANIDPALPTVVITHGWQPPPFGADGCTPPEWVAPMVELVRSSRAPAKVNVVSFAWPEAATLNFLAADTATRDAGGRLARQLLSKIGQNAGVHLVGHSLGAKVNAFAANRLASREVSGIAATILDSPDRESIFRDLLRPASRIDWVENLYGFPHEWAGIVAKEACDLLPGPDMALCLLGQSLGPFGTAITGAENHRVWWATHSGVHDAYTGVVPASPPSWDPDAPTTFSRMVALLGSAFQQPAEWNLVGAAFAPGGSSVVLTEHSPASASGPVDVPAGATHFSFDFEFVGPGDGDYLAVDIGSKRVFKFTGVNAAGTDSQPSGLLSVSEFAGSTINLAFILESVGLANAQVIVSNPTFYTIHSAPVAVAPEAITAEATAPTGADVVLDASGSTDPDGDVASYAWSGSFGVVSGQTVSVHLPLGVHSVELEVADSRGLLDKAVVIVTVRDSTPPVIQSHEDEVAEATGAAGTVVTYVAPTWTDAVAGSGPATCVPASGAVFLLGTTTVTCTASDGVNAGSTTFSVTVRDSTPPTLQMPEFVAVDANSPVGAVVTYSVSAADAVDKTPVVSCVPLSGAIMPIGQTTVGCTATDFTGNVATGAFGVLVKAGAAQIQDLVALVGTFDVRQGIQQSLDTKLERAMAALSAAHAGDRPTACRQLAAFVNEVSAQSGKELTEAQAALLVTAATRIQAVIGCGAE